MKEAYLNAIVDNLFAVHNGPVRYEAGVPVSFPFPSEKVVEDLLPLLRDVLFADYFRGHCAHDNVQEEMKHKLKRVTDQLTAQIHYGLSFEDPGKLSSKPGMREAKDIMMAFLDQLPAIREKLVKDAEAAYSGDPSCTNSYEPILCFPSVVALFRHRVAHALHELGVPLLPRMIAEIAHRRTAIDIHPAAKIGDYFFVDHGTGVVIGETCVIGDHVSLYHGVSLGAKNFPVDADCKAIKGQPRHPIIGNHVTIYMGAVLLGRITIGDHIVIGANVWVTRYVAPHSRIYEGECK